VPTRFLEQPIFTQKFHIGSSIYDTPQYCDFIVYHPQKWPNNLVIESKWQEVGGSVDEKYPYLVLNIQMKYTTPTILLLDGGGYKKGAEQWIRSQSGHGNLLLVFNMQQFTAWVNKGNL
jgi:DNA adenine methylase